MNRQEDARNAKRRRGKEKWRSGERNVEGDVIPTGTKRSGGISQILQTANWQLASSGTTSLCLTAICYLTNFAVLRRLLMAGETPPTRVRNYLLCLPRVPAVS